MKDDKNKNRIDLIQPNFISGLGDVLTYGANKYTSNNWKDTPDPEDRYYSAAMRHLLAWRNNELLDPESGLPHLHHVAANIMFLSYFSHGKKKPGGPRRVNPGGADV